MEIFAALKVRIYKDRLTVEPGCQPEWMKSKGDRYLYSSVFIYD